MFDKVRIFLVGFFCVLLIWTAGCVSLQTQEEGYVQDLDEIKREGVYHKVKKGETLWRIAKVYNVPIQDITKANNIPKAARIEKNQLVFIPGADAIREILLDSDKVSNDFIWPVKGKIIRYFHEGQADRAHKGIDIRVEEGETVRATRPGSVVFADYLSGYGYTVILDHLDGLYSVYARNAKLLVNLGESVLQNQNIAQVGTSRDLAYLHFQIRKKSVEDNPLYYLP